MDMPEKCEWFNVDAIVPPLAVLFTSALGLFTRSAMSLQAEILWIIATVIMAFLVWFKSAKTAQTTKQRELNMIANFNEIKQLIQLIAKPGITLEDIREAATSIDDSLERTIGLEGCPSGNH